MNLHVVGVGGEPLLVGLDGLVIVAPAEVGESQVVEILGRGRSNLEGLQESLLGLLGFAHPVVGHCQGVPCFGIVPVEFAGGFQLFNSYLIAA